MKVNDVILEENKSLFERAIIEAFKESQEIGITSKLKIALDEMKFYIQEILELNNSNSKIKLYLLNPNILDKLARLLERKLFYVKLMIGRIFENLVEDITVPILSNSTETLIKFANEVLNLQDEIKTTNVAIALEKKLVILLNYMKSLKHIDYEQEAVIKDLAKNISSINVVKEINQVSYKIILKIITLNIQYFRMNLPIF